MANYSSGFGSVGEHRTDEFKAEAQENATDHAHYDRHRNEQHRTLHKARRAKHQD